MSSFQRGTRIGKRYRLVDEIGRGGMGTVWCAYDEVLERLVAVKLMVSGGEQLRKEARAAARLSHPHITSVFDYGESPPYIVMELLEGDTLASRLAATRPDPREARVIAGQVASALDAAHRRGVVHRDVTPGNIVLTPSGAKVLDFGISTVGRAETATHGTPTYVAPEVLAGAPATPESDVYSFGVILGELMPNDLVELQARCRSTAPGERPTMADIAGILAPPAAPAGGAAKPPPAPRTRLLTGALTTRIRQHDKGLVTLLATSTGVVALVLVLLFALNRPDTPTPASTPPSTSTRTTAAVVASAPGRLEVRLQNNGNPDDNQINARFDLYNLGEQPIEMSHVQIRYWFTAGDDSTRFEVACDYAKLDCNNVKRQIENLADSRSGADRVLVLSFGANAGWLTPRESTGEIQIRFNKPDWTEIDENDDYSYRPAFNYTKAPNVTAYVDGKLAWGKEPT